MAEEQQPIDYDKLIGELQMIAKFGDSLSGRAFQAIQELLKKVSLLKEKCASLQGMLDASRDEFLQLEKEIEEASKEAKRDSGFPAEREVSDNDDDSDDKEIVSKWINELVKFTLKKNNWHDEI